MSNVIIQAEPTVIEKMKKDYQEYLLPKKIPYTSFVAKKNGTTITAYTSGKVMFQGIHAAQEANRWGTASNSKETNKPTILPQNFSQMAVLGSDEVGNGSYFGPLVVCAAYVNRQHLEELKKLGVRDSKELKDNQIVGLAEKIKRLIPYQQLIVTPKKYNEIQPEYNAVRMKVALHNQTIQLLLKKIAPEKPEAILIDQFTPEANFKKYVRLEKEPVKEKIYFITKGEQYHLSVAAASIICRAAFLEELAKVSKETGLTIPSGAGAKADQIAAKLLQKGGLSLLENYAKLHFANTEKAKKLVASKS